MVDKGTPSSTNIALHNLKYKCEEKRNREQE